MSIAKIFKIYLIFPKINLQKEKTTCILKIKKNSDPQKKKAVFMYKTEKLNVQTFGNYKHLQGEFDNIKIRFTDSNRTKAQQNGIYKKHTHIMYEAIFIEEGSYKCTVNDEIIQLQKYDIIIIQPGQTHKDYLKTGTVWYTFHFTIDIDDNMNFLIFNKNTLPREQIISPDTASIDFLKTIIKLFEAESKNDIYECYLIHNALFGAVFRKILSLYSPVHLNEQFTSRHMMQQEAAKLISVFHNNLSNQPSLTELCKLSAMSKSSLHRTCQLYFNMPPRKAFLHYKMNHIVDFIKKNPHVTIKELSNIFGFKTQFHFSRVFKQEIGSYPSLLLQKYKKKN